jgi:hypothetical protein
VGGRRFFMGEPPAAPSRSARGRLPPTVAWDCRLFLSSLRRSLVSVLRSSRGERCGASEQWISSRVVLQTRGTIVTALSRFFVAGVTWWGARALRGALGRAGGRGGPRPRAASSPNTSCREALDIITGARNQVGTPAAGAQPQYQHERDTVTTTGSPT